jgi:hypothetical protein
MFIRSLLIGVAVAALAGPVLAATNLLPSGSATVSGSSIHDGFNQPNAASNLVNGTSLQTYPNGDTRWVFADGSSADQTLVVNLGSAEAFDFAGFVASGQDRIPTSLEILTSSDGITFTPVAGPSAVTGYGSAGLFDDGLSFKTVDAQYVEYDFGGGSISDCNGCGGGANQGAGIVSLALAVPEPATWAMMLLGVGMIGGGLRLTRRKNASGFAAA